MKFLSKYKIINVVMIIISALVYFAVELYFDKLCNDTSCLYDYQYSYYDPVSAIALGLLIILIGLLLVPSDLFRKWLWYIFPVAMIHTAWWVSNISVYSGNILVPDRGRAAQSNMEFYGVITIVFVLGHLAFYRYKRYKNRALQQD